MYPRQAFWDEVDESRAADEIWNLHCLGRVLSETTSCNNSPILAERWISVSHSASSIALAFLDRASLESKPKDQETALAALG